MHIEFSRRTLLGAVGAVALVGCTPSPVIDPAGHSPAAKQTIEDARRSAALTEWGLENLARQVSGASGLAQPVASWSQGVAAMHAAHKTTLAQLDPFAGTQADKSPLIDFPTPSVASFPDATSAYAKLREAETAAAQAHTQQLVSAEAGPAALLWASLAACASAVAEVATDPNANQIPPPEPGRAVPSKVEFGNPAQAMQVLLSHQRALIFALETMYGKIPTDTAFSNDIRARLTEAGKQRDATEQALTKAGASQTPGAIGYQIPGDLADPAQQPVIWAGLETNIANAWGPVVASSEPEQRGANLDEMVAQLGQARRRGATLAFWPGWV